MPIAGSSATATSTSSRDRRVTSHRAPILTIARGGNVAAGVSMDSTMALIMWPPFNLPRTALHAWAGRLAELNCFIQTSALPRSKIRMLSYQSVSIE